MIHPHSMSFENWKRWSRDVNQPNKMVVGSWTTAHKWPWRFCCFFCRFVLVFTALCLFLAVPPVLFSMLFSPFRCFFKCGGGFWGGLREGGSGGLLVLFGDVSTQCMHDSLHVVHDSFIEFIISTAPLRWLKTTALPRRKECSGLCLTTRVN